jgi:hypothetical protein
MIYLTHMIYLVSPLLCLTPPHRSVLPSHRVKMSLLPPLYLSVTFHPIVSTLETKLKH